MYVWGVKNPFVFDPLESLSVCTLLSRREQNTYCNFIYVYKYIYIYSRKKNQFSDIIGFPNRHVSNFTFVLVNYTYLYIYIYIWFILLYAYITRRRLPKRGQRIIIILLLWYRVSITSYPPFHVTCTFRMNWRSQLYTL